MNEELMNVLFGFAVIVFVVMASAFLGAGMASSYVDGVANGICRATHDCLVDNSIIGLMSLIDDVLGAIFLGLAFVFYYAKSKRCVGAKQNE